MKRLKILYFINGAAPSDQDVAIAAAIPAQVCFRNAHFIDEGHKVEDCDGVMGEVPETYSECPTLEDAQKKHEEMLRELQAKANGEASEPAPKPKAKTESGGTKQAPAWTPQ